MRSGCNRPGPRSGALRALLLRIAAPSFLVATPGVLIPAPEFLIPVPLLMLAAPPAARAADAKSVTAILLEARDEVTDSDFAESIVLVMNNLGPAPVGIIVNRPTTIPVSRLFPDEKRLAQLHDKVYFGGPVETETVWFLFRAPTPPQDAIRAFDGVYLSSNRKLLLRLLGREKPMDGLRIFVGHAGWAPGQLEGEIAQGAWTLERARPEAIFNGKSEHPWPAPPGAPKGPKSTT